jgi:hypothetical protein
VPSHATGHFRPNPSYICAVSQSFSLVPKSSHVILGLLLLTMSTADFLSPARSATTKRVIAQLIHEKLVSVSLLDGIDKPRACITGPGDKKRWMTLPIRDSSCLSRHVHPNDFGVPAILYYDDRDVTEDDPGSIFEFATPWFDCDEKTKTVIVTELQNSSKILGAQQLHL